jgi:hypothetical protein
MTSIGGLAHLCTIPKLRLPHPSRFFEGWELRDARKIKSPGSQPGLNIASWYAIHQKQL